MESDGDSIRNSCDVYLKKNSFAETSQTVQCMTRLLQRKKSGCSLVRDKISSKVVCCSGLFVKTLLTSTNGCPCILMAGNYIFSTSFSFCDFCRCIFLHFVWILLVLGDVTTWLYLKLPVKQELSFSSRSLFEDNKCLIFRDSKLAVLEHCPRNLIQVFPPRFFATKSANGFKLTSDLFSLSTNHFTLYQQLCIHSKLF